MPKTAGAENLGEVRHWKSALVLGTHTLSAKEPVPLVGE